MTPELILRDLPLPIRTPRLLIKAPEAGMGAALFEAINETLVPLQDWMMWADKMKTLEDSELFIRKKAADFISRQNLVMVAFDQEDRLIGCTGLNHVNDFQTPIMQVGYWCRMSEQNKGYATEIANALTRYGFEVLGLKKITIEIDSENQPSIAVAERLGFELEYTVKWGVPKPNTDEMRILNVYSRFNIDSLLPLAVTWG